MQYRQARGDFYSKGRSDENGDGRGNDWYIQEYREYDLNTGEKTLEYREEYEDGDLSEPYTAYPDVRDTSVFSSFKDVQEYMHTKTDKLYMVLA